MKHTNKANWNATQKHNYRRATRLARFYLGNKLCDKLTGKVMPVREIKINAFAVDPRFGLADSDWMSI